MGPLFRFRKLLGILRVQAWRMALVRHRVAAGIEHARVLKLLGELRTVVDIGANRGQFALAARHCHPRSLIVSFEPLEQPADTYARVFAGDARASVHKTAIGPRSGQATMYLSGRDDSSSLLPISEEQERIFPGTRGVGTRNVHVATLGDCLTVQDLVFPALLKLDVQGFELDALRGCEAVLEMFAWVYVECSFTELYEGQSCADQVVRWLQDRGFTLCGFYNPSYDRQGRAVQADFLFAAKAAESVS